MKKIFKTSPYVYMCVLFALTVVGYYYEWIYWMVIPFVLVFLLQLLMVFTPKSVSIKVKHKKGKFNSNLLLEIKGYFTFILFKMYYWTGKQMKTSFIFTEKSLYNQNSENQLDWLKSIGTKSGVKTSTNKEEIAVFRCENFEQKKFSVGNYIRLGDGKFSVFGKKEGYLNNNELELSINRNIELKHLLPVVFYAGGNQKPENNFEYTIKLSI